MSECGHEVLDAYYNDELKMRIGQTWASVMRCQDGDDYDECGPPESRNPKDHPYIHILDEYLPDKSIKILEVGAGDGSETRMFIDHGYKNMTGITVGRENVSRGKELYDVDLQYMDMHFTSFPNASFDAVIGFQTFEHTPAPILFGLEVNRLLKPGGKILMEVPGGEWHFQNESNPHHLNVLEPWQGKAMLMRCGFINVSCVVRSDSTHEGLRDSQYIFYGEKIGDGDHNNHFNDVVNGKYLKKEK